MSTIPISTEVAPRFCGDCGHEVSPKASFCGECGRSTVQPQPEQLPAEPDRPPAGAGKAGNRRWLILAAAAFILTAIAVPLVLVMHPSSNQKPSAGPVVTPSTASAAPAPSAVSPTGTAMATEAPEQQAAESLASLLAQSVTDRAAIDDAYDDVQSCGPSLSADAQAFQNAATSRQQLVSQLADLPSGAALPVQMLQELSGAWQASAATDSDYAQWALDEQAGNCTPDDTADSDFQAASGPNQEATQDKLAFTSLWDQLADSYGLTQYSPDQL
jgi:hypothetical protein